VPRPPRLPDQSSKGSKPSTVAIPADAALSFLKDTKGAVTWSIRNLADTLKVGRREAEQIAALLEAQGYAKRSGAEWMTTPQGESVSGAKAPRFARESVESALDALKERIRQVNSDRTAQFKITDAVAFGDFLLGRARVQAADVGIALARKDGTAEPRTAAAARDERKFLRQLRGRSALVQIRTYAPWMKGRSHVDLLR
jgi:hypothetical protein